MASSKVRYGFWERSVSEQRESGLSGRAWCKANGVAPASFYLWRKRLTAGPAADIAANSAVARGSSEIQWFPLEPALTSAASASSGVTLRVGTVGVEIATGFDTRALSDVLSVLESRC